ncbi:hypothetical protein KUH32_03885 [Thalassococcus sp. CAU 1522]|uniref:Nuclease n=1 Tax=Thalassococcus arenae TaxID=2851652 RepID=A0ABS6N4G1_9RHOB|nr:hypothetical protein [Thalassococcus arenae]MBV2358904.1 hypothetical protein [Thalassococcus arenae]
MRRVLVICLLLLSGLPGRPVAAQETTAPGTDRFGHGDAWAVSGHVFDIKGRRFTLAGVVCPDPGTETGREAKALMNQFLRTRIRCRARPGPEDGWEARCEANSRDVAEALISSGLCRTP